MQYHNLPLDMPPAITPTGAETYTDSKNTPHSFINNSGTNMEIQSNAINSAINSSGGDMQTQTSKLQDISNIDTGISNSAHIITGVQTHSVVSRMKAISIDLNNLKLVEDASLEDFYTRRRNLLGLCYDLCLQVNSPTNYQAQKELSDYCILIELKNTKSFTDKILKCIFANLKDKNRSAYKAVIEFAISKGVPSGGLPEFIKDNGGIQGTRLEKYKTKRAADKTPTRNDIIEGTNSFVKTKQLALIDDPLLKQHLPVVNAGEKFLLIATRLPDGQVEINATTAAAGALKAALMACYKVNKDDITKQLTVTEAPTSVSVKTECRFDEQSDAMGGGISQPSDHIDPIQKLIDKAIDNHSRSALAASAELA